MRYGSSFTRVTPPGRLWHVEWTAARRFDRPDDRRDRSRTVAVEAVAAAQIRSVQLWPDHCELLGVWVTVGSEAGRIVWQPVEASALRLADSDAERYTALAEAWQQYPTLKETPRDRPERSTGTGD